MVYRLFVPLITATNRKAVRLFLAALFCFYAVEVQALHENISKLIAVAPFALGFAGFFTLLIFYPVWILVVRKEARSKGMPFRAFVMSQSYDELLADYSKEINKKK